MRNQKTHSRAMPAPDLWNERVRDTPIPHQRTLRRDSVSVITSSFGGKFVPLKMVPLLPEDGANNSRLNLTVQMAETAEMLLNSVTIQCQSWFVPKLALSRFQDMGQIERSFNGINEQSGAPIPWFETEQDMTKEIYKVLGLHYNDMDAYNTDYVESYNAVWNYIAKQRSDALQPRDDLDGTLAPAFWEQTQMKHVVPTFDQALTDGAVPIQIASGGKLPVQGIGTNYTLGATPASGVRDGSGQNVDYPASYSGERMEFRMDGPTDPNFPDIFVELEAEGISMSIADIDLARETTAWARLRNQYQGLSEDYMMDQLLAGIRISDQQLKNPILVGQSDTIVGMSQRYATDSANLQKSVTAGQTMLQVPVRAPATQCGGVIVVTAQALPTQIYERQRDYYFAADKVSDLPNRTSDELDPQPVSLIRNVEVDEKYSVGEAGDLFGYAPLNHEWVRRAPNVGGKYYQPDPSAPWTEVRNRLWDANVVDPVLGPDFYVATTLKHDVFETTTVDPFEWWLSGDVSITGLTYFGPALLEGTDDYDKVLAQVDQERHIGDGTDQPVDTP